MPRPKNKDELLESSADRYARLRQSIGALTPVQRELPFPFEHRDRNLRDLVAHLLEWQLMMLRWYETAMDGEEPLMPAEGYTWKTTPALNAKIWERYQNVSLERVRESLAVSHDSLLAVIHAHSNDELFTKRHYSWTGTTSLGSYLTSSLPSHYDWALKIIARFTRSIK